MTCHDASINTNSMRKKSIKRSYFTLLDDNKLCERINWKLGGWEDETTGGEKGWEGEAPERGGKKARVKEKLPCGKFYRK